MEGEQNASVHLPVLREEILVAFAHLAEFVEPALFDGTLGGGGHAEALLMRYPNLRLFGTDQDPAACDRVRARLSPFADRIFVRHGNFSELDRLPWNAPSQFHAMLLDLGISSDQLDDPTRGFSFRGEVLDMRMNPQAGASASDVLNMYSESELRRVFREGGVRQGVGSLVSAVVRNRPILSVAQFRLICEEAFAVAQARKRQQKAGSVSHPATVPFQALRIEVNNEFRHLSTFLERAPERLINGGRLAVISFHSAEDELVTHSMRRWSRVEAVRRGLPAEPALGRILTAKAILPIAAEIENNPRSRSARLRIFERQRHDDRAESV